MRCLIAALLLLSTAAAFENEFHVFSHAHTFDDPTFAAMASGANVPFVSSGRAYDPVTEGTLEVLGQKEGLADRSWVTVQLDYPPATTMPASQLSSMFVGLFGPSGVNISTTTPVKFSLATADASFASTGRAQLRFRIINMRVPLDFAFLTNCKMPKYNAQYRGLRDCTVLLRVTNVTMADYDEPLRPALLRDRSPHTVRLAWTTATAVQGARVEYWPEGDEGATRVALPLSRTPYTRDDLCSEPASTYGFFHPGVRHVATMGDLQPGSRVAYRIRDDEGRATEPVVFKVPSAPGPDATAKLLVFADLGRGTEDGSKTWEDYGRPALNTSMRMVQDLASGAAGEDGIAHFGDISYATGFLPVWDVYGDMMADLLGQSVYSLNGGNHEMDAPADVTPPTRTVTLYNGSDSGGECGVAVNGWFPMPWRSIDTPWFSYDVGPVHMVFMATEHDFRINTPQWQWLRDDLSSVDRDVTPWVVFGGHRPMYVDSTYRGRWSSDLDVSALLIKHVEPLLIDNNVDIAFWGHNHVVQRLCRLKQSQCVAKASGTDNRFTKGGGGTVHLVVGAAGATFSNNVNRPPLPMTAFTAYDYGHSRLVVSGRRQLSWEWVSNIDGSVLDSMVIVDDSGPSDEGPWGAGAIAGLTVGSVAAVGAVAALVWVGRRRGGILRTRTTASGPSEEDQLVKEPAAATGNYVAATVPASA